MSSVEIIILCVTGAIACITYIVKHFKRSECWSKESCFMCKMDIDDKSKSDLSIESNENKESKESKKEYVLETDANLKSHHDDFLPQKRDYLSSSDTKTIVSSTI